MAPTFVDAGEPVGQRFEPAAPAYGAPSTDQIGEGKRPRPDAGLGENDLADVLTGRPDDQVCLPQLIRRESVTEVGRDVRTELCGRGHHLLRRSLSQIERAG